MTDAAALPLTTITAWEMLFDRFGLTTQSTGDLLVLGAAGGVGYVFSPHSQGNTRSMFETPERLLRTVAGLVDGGVVRTTVTRPSTTSPPRDCARRTAMSSRAG